MDDEDGPVEDEAEGAAGDVGVGALDGVDGVGALAGDGGDEHGLADEVRDENHDSRGPGQEGQAEEDGAQDLEVWDREHDIADQGHDADDDAHGEDGRGNREKEGPGLGEGEGQAAGPADGAAGGKLGGGHAGDGPASDRPDEEGREEDGEGAPGELDHDFFGHEDEEVGEAAADLDVVQVQDAGGDGGEVVRAALGGKAERAAPGLVVVSFEPEARELAYEADEDEDKEGEAQAGGAKGEARADSEEARPGE